MVVDRFGVAALAVPEPAGDAAPARRHLLRRRGDRLQVLDADRAHDLRHDLRRRPRELEALGERLEQLVRIARMHAVDVEVAGDVGTGEAEIAATRGEIGRAARCLQLEGERRVGGTGGAPVVGGEPQRQPAADEDLEDLGEGELRGRRRARRSDRAAFSVNVVIVVAPPSRRGRGVASRGRTGLFTAPIGRAAVERVELVPRVERVGVERLVAVELAHPALDHPIRLAFGRADRHGRPEADVDVGLARSEGVERPALVIAQPDRAQPDRLDRHVREEPVDELAHIARSAPRCLG